MEGELAEAVLHVAATRPALLWGVPLELAVLIVCAAAEAGMFHWAGPVIGPPLWVLAAFLVRRDYNAPRIWQLWLQTAMQCWDADVWGGSSASPFPINQPLRLRGVAR